MKHALYILVGIFWIVAFFVVTMTAPIWGFFMLAYYMGSPAPSREDIRQPHEELH